MFLIQISEPFCFIFVKNGRALLVDSCNIIGNILMNHHPFHPSVPQQLLALREDRIRGWFQLFVCIFANGLRNSKWKQHKIVTICAYDGDHRSEKDPYSHRVTQVLVNGVEETKTSSSYISLISPGMRAVLWVPDYLYKDTV